ncbi:MAG: segregation/condensation protein A [Nocardioidaceae bacterium]
MNPATDEAAAAPRTAGDGAFAVHLDNFEGPFDLLLQLISQHRLDITEVALSQVTDEFLAHTKALGSHWELEQTTQFLVVAATLLDLKIVRLLPKAEVESEEDLALLEARDLLFARLMQYRAFKQVAALLETCMAAEARQTPRSVGLDEKFAAVLPEVLIALGPVEFAALARKALAPKAEPRLALGHLHAPGSVSESKQQCWSTGCGEPGPRHFGRWQQIHRTP